MQKITLTISSDIALQLQHLASEQKVTVEVIATDLLNQAMQGKKPEAFRIVQSERIGQPVFSDSEGLREIIHRQDEEIIWLRDQITRLSTLPPTTHVIKHEYPAFNATLRDNPENPFCDEKKNLKPGNKKSETADTIQPYQVSVEDVQYSVQEPGIESDELLTSNFSGPDRVDERTLRDSIGGVRGEVDYTISEAAAIAGESEAVILEFITNGFLPAKMEGTMYRIRGADLQRYMMSK